MSMHRREFCKTVGGMTAGSFAVGALTAPLLAADGTPRLPADGTVRQATRTVETVSRPRPFFEQFAQANWWKQWQLAGQPSHTRLVDVPREVSSSGRGLRVDVPKGSNLGSDFGYSFARLQQSEPEEAAFEYRIKFGQSFTGHGKIPGLTGTYGRAGWGGRIPRGDDGWSARMGFSANEKEHVSVSFYSYHLDHPKQNRFHGDFLSWQANDGMPFRLQREKWYHLKGHVKLNTPGRRDGELRGWIDDQLVQHQTKLRFRTVRKLKIERLWFNVWHGGGAPSPVDMDVTFADVRIEPLA